MLVWHKCRCINERTVTQLLAADFHQSQMTNHQQNCDSWWHCLSCWQSTWACSQKMSTDPEKHQWLAKHQWKSVSIKVEMLQKPQRKCWNTTNWESVSAMVTTTFTSTWEQRSHSSGQSICKNVCWSTAQKIREKGSTMLQQKWSSCMMCFVSNHSVNANQLSEKQRIEAVGSLSLTKEKGNNGTVGKTLSDGSNQRFWTNECHKSVWHSSDSDVGCIASNHWCKKK